MAVNKAILVGRLGRDPEVRPLPSGQSVTSFSLATNDSYTDRSGQRQERTEWHNIVVFGKQAELCYRYLKKGSEVYVEGRIQTRQYEAKDGSGKRSRTEIVAQRVQFLGGRQGASSGAGDEPLELGGGGGETVAPIDDEDIPF